MGLDRMQYMVSRISKMPKTIAESSLYIKWSSLKQATKASILIIVCSVIWICSGFIIPSHHSREESTQGLLSSYQILSSTAELHTQELQLTAVVEYSQQVMLRSAIDGKVTKVYAKDGQVVKAGEKILMIEPEGKSHNLESASSELQSKRMEYKAHQQLFNKKLLSSSALATSLAALKAAESSYERAKKLLQETIITAPTDGVIDKILLKEGDYIHTMQGSDIVQFISGEKRVVVMIPERYYNNINNNSLAKIKTIYGEVFEGNIIFISKRIDEVTKTFRVEIIVKNSNLIPGNTVIALLPLDTSIAHKIPVSALALNMEGNLGVFISNQDKIAEFKIIEVVGEELGKIWVKGLPLHADIVIRGQHYLVNGKKLYQER